MNCPCKALWNVVLCPPSHACCNCLVFCVWQVDCVSLCSDTSAATEEKVQMAFSQAQQYQPCVLLLKDIEVLGRERDGLGEDARVIATLRQLLLDTDPALRYDPAHLLWVFKVIACFCQGRSRDRELRPCTVPFLPTATPCW